MYKDPQSYTQGCCNIANHHMLLLEVNEVLNEIDIHDWIEDSGDRSAYSPELPGLVGLIVDFTLSKKSITDVFKEMIGEEYGPTDDRATELLNRLSILQKRWLWWQHEMN